MNNSQTFNFNDINLLAQNNIQGFLQEWLPGGIINGHDYCPLNPTRADKHIGSFRININTAQWHDFATGDSGCGLISLYAYLNNISHRESAEYLANKINYQRNTNMIDFLPYTNTTAYTIIPLETNSNYQINPKAIASWAYRDIGGKIIYVVDRIDKTDGSKIVLPRSFVKDETSGKQGWIQKKLLTNNILYNQEAFTDKESLPVLIVEGEKTCEAAKKLYNDRFWCTTWNGGAQGVYHLNHDLIKNRTVYLLADNDSAGKKAMNYLAQKLSPNNEVFIVDYPEADFPEGWDIADKFPDNWDLERFTSLFDTARQYQPKDNASTAAKEEKAETLTSEVIPFNGNVDGLELVNELISIIKQHVILRDEEAIAIAYWILQTYNINAFTFAPRLLIISPEKRCGKTTLLQLLEMLCYRAWSVGNCTPAVLYKVIEQEQPTVLMDEADSFFNSNNDMRNIINVGFQNKFGVARSGGKNFEAIKSYKVFAMMAIAAINTLPDTIMDRGIKIGMRRKLAHEKTLPLRERVYKNKFDLIRSKCRKLMLEIGTPAGEKIIEDISGLNDRACDVWEGMISIADLLGDKERVVKAAIKLSHDTSTDSESIKNILLKDILHIFQKYSFCDVSSANLIEELVSIEASPWSEISKGKPLTPHKLAFLLKEYKISTFQKNECGKNVNHYGYSSFLDTFERYIPDELERVKKMAEAEDPWEFQQETDFNGFK